MDPTDLTDFIEDDDGHMSYQRLYEAVQERGELIITVDAANERAVRTGLSMRKARETAKLKNAGIDPGEEVLSFTVTPVKDDPAKINIQITLGARKNIRVYSMKVPDDTF